MNLKKNFSMVLFFLALTSMPAWANSECDQIIKSNFDQMKVIQDRDGVSSYIDVLSTLADELEEELVEEAESQQITLEVAQDRFEKIVMIRQCANGLGFSTFSL